MPSSPPASSVRLGTPLFFIERPGTRYFTRVPTARKVVATAKTTQPVVSPRWRAQPSTAARTSRLPGSIGGTLPTTPTPLPSATTTPTAVTASALHPRSAGNWHPPPPVDRARDLRRPLRVTRPHWHGWRPHCWCT